MAEDYTPTTDNVRNVYAYIGQGFAPSERKSAADAFAEFDRWLAAHDAEVKAAALRPLDDLGRLWLSQAAEYPAIPEGRAARAAVGLCYDEMHAAMDTAQEPA